jgi:hypothetical protein
LGQITPFRHQKAHKVIPRTQMTRNMLLSSFIGYCLTFNFKRLNHQINQLKPAANKPDVASNVFLTEINRHLPLFLEPKDKTAQLNHKSLGTKHIE